MLADRNRYAHKLVQLPFDQVKKRKVCVLEIPGESVQVRVYVKGAPEYVIPLCSSTLNCYRHSLAQQDLTDEDIEKKVDCAATMASNGEGLKVITYAYKDLAVSALNDLMLNHHLETEEFR